MLAVGSFQSAIPGSSYRALCKAEQGAGLAGPILSLHLDPGIKDINRHGPKPLQGPWTSASRSSFTGPRGVGKSQTPAGRLNERFATPAKFHAVHARNAGLPHNPPLYLRSMMHPSISISFFRSSEKASNWRSISHAHSGRSL